MAEAATTSSAAFREAFSANERQELINTGKVAAALVFFLMPLGSALDAIVFPKRFTQFLILRLICSLLIGMIWGLYYTDFGKRNCRWLGLPIAWLPSFFMTWMIYDDPEGAASQYYAGLNLVLLGISVVVRWSTKQSILAVCGVHLMYLGSCTLKSGFAALTTGFSNYYFLALTGIIVVVGNHFFNRLRFREFAAQFELDQNKKILEENNQKLDDQNKELADTIQKLTEAESQLVQSEKMASLGRMSAGIIHEINNPLNFATTGLFTLRKKSKYVAPEQQEEYNDILKDVEDGVSRVKNIVSDLRMFTHPNTDNLDEVAAAEVVASALRFLSNEMKDKVTIEQQFAAQQVVHANKNKLIHVFVNLIQNSLDALKEKPFANGERPTIWLEGRDSATASCLIIRDNGPGITSEHVDKIFDPFYTTKEVGAGMGLGLSICYRIMQECKGKISVRTEPGKFCEFTLEFPKQP